MQNKPIDIILAVKQACQEHREEAPQHFSAKVVESIAQRVVRLLQESDASDKKVLLD
jgi:hypothetical protein